MSFGIKTLPESPADEVLRTCFTTKFNYVIELMLLSIKYIHAVIYCIKNTQIFQKHISLRCNESNKCSQRITLHSTTFSFTQQSAAKTIKEKNLSVKVPNKIMENN